MRNNQTARLIFFVNLSNEAGPKRPENGTMSVLKRLKLRLNERGQQLVEFTLVFVLTLVILWIPADFGLAFLTGQLASNAAREGARIASASSTLPVVSDGVPNAISCAIPCSGQGYILEEASRRIWMALMPNAQVTLWTETPSTCNRQVFVRVNGTYNFFFYQILRLMGATVPNGTQIDRLTQLRWEHQC